jgi:glycosyltransferase involved in cell wall biosynthesis
LGLKSTNNNIHFISGNLKESQMREIYEHDKVKAYISFSHGESFGIPIMEFAAITGKPLVIPYHSGLMEYIRP